MSDTVNVRIAKRGVLTLPKSIRESYGLRPGDSLALLDLGGVFVLSPQHSEMDALCDRVTGALTGRGETLESVLAALREERERYASKSQGVS